MAGVGRLAKPRPALICIGISTGGPKTLTQVFRDLPPLNAAILVVQHMPRFINQSMRKSLDSCTAMDVLLAEDGSHLASATVYIAPSEVHLRVVENERIELADGPKVCYVCPSIDVTMQSLVARNGDRIMGIVMTGMGSDGANGVAHVKAIGGSTVVQDQRTSVIFSMPKAAIGTGQVDSILSLEGIRQKMISFAGSACAH